MALPSSTIRTTALSARPTQDGSGILTGCPETAVVLAVTSDKALVMRVARRMWSLVPTHFLLTTACCLPDE